MLKSSQLWAPWLQDSSFQHLLDPKAGPEGGIRKFQWRLIKGVVFWTTSQKFMVEATKVRTPGLYFPTPSWVWSWPWGWYQKMPIMFKQRSSMLNNFPKIHGWGIKTVHARTKDDTLPCKCQALAWQKEPKAWMDPSLAEVQAIFLSLRCVVKSFGK